MKELFLTVFLLYSTQVAEHPPPSEITVETDLFSEAVVCIKKYEGWHSAKHYPYVGYGHRLLPDEHIKADISESFADSLLKKDLRQKCSVFRRFGKDSLILGVLAYQVGEYTLLGHGKRPKSKLIEKLESGNRDIYREYISYRKYKGRVVLSIECRRKEEFKLLFDKTKSIKKSVKMITEGSNVVIVPSRELSDMKLSDLAGKKGVVTEDMCSHKRINQGFMVRLTEGAYMNEEEWFIPFMSVENDK